MSILVAEKTGDSKKLKNLVQNHLVQNQSFGSIVGARPTAATRNGGRDNTAGMITT